MKQRFSYSFLFIVTIIFVVNSGFATAEGPISKPDFEALAEKLELSDRQKEDFVNILDSQYAKAEGLIHSTDSPFKKRKMLRQHRAETQKLMSGVLTKEQMEELKDISHEYRQNFKKRLQQ